MQWEWIGLHNTWVQKCVAVYSHGGYLYWETADERAEKVMVIEEVKYLRVDGLVTVSFNVWIIDIHSVA
ncbi:hypothetical protein AVEN_148905-1 [Araneus ventricosus]|uniref:Uncharacterized protein n=1 Tax=Araneus ventricosus TaxID=182803 RepID=A0A4Y2DI88_ARAVE|nr:hypothetical protein AVEN_148905-1 [Araneus ventricosus]